MIDGNPNEFLEAVYNGTDVYFIFDNKKYFGQGYNINNGKWHYEIYEINTQQNAILWECTTETVDECYNLFLLANIFNGKTFLEAESEIEWVDE